MRVHAVGSGRVVVASVAALLLVAAAGVALALQTVAASADAARSKPAAAEYVGRATCASCHVREMKLFEGSHHDLAMQPANETTVRGDFSGVSFRHFGVTSTFYRRDGKYFVKTDGPDGALAEFEVTYTFGVFPLQQYLIKLPGGRYQALSVAWDSRPKKDGGQRWFHLYPDERIPARDILHWTGPAQNWNYMCAECHSTNLHKGWLPGERRYETTFSEIDVSCEACHGPGSAHVAWARASAAARGAAPESDGSAGAQARGSATTGRSAADVGLLVDLRGEPAAWVMDPKTGITRRDRPRQSRAEIETCARCHARRSVLFEDYLPGRPLLATHKPALLRENLYYADGQQQDEVYEYGSFLQSRMYAAGVSCGDCHDPHSSRLVADADAVCARCHSPARFASPAHHHHKLGTKGARCVECHMPAKNYMVIDARRDHSFRVLRPDLTEKIGTPNACTGCHRDKGARWASQTVEKWYPGGRSTTPHYGEALHAGRRGLPGAELALVRLADDLAQPGIARATAVELLADYLSPASLASLEHALKDQEGLVRAAALDALAALPPAERLRLASPLLNDPLRGVRIEAVSALAAEAHQLAADQRSALESALAEYRAAQATSADRPEAYLNLGALDARLGDRAAARRSYEEGLRIGPWLTALWVNLADLLREEGNDAEGERVLRRGLEAAADKAELHHALGLNLARQKRPDDAIRELKRGLDLAPDNTRLAYVYGVALLSAGRGEDALGVFAKALEKRPGDRDLLVALATANRDRGDLGRARDYARRLVEAAPGDPAARQLLAELEGGGRPGGAEAPPLGGHSQ